MSKSDSRILQDTALPAESTPSRKAWKAPQRVRLETEETRGGAGVMSEVPGFMT